MDLHVRPIEEVESNEMSDAEQLNVQKAEQKRQYNRDYRAKNREKNNEYIKSQYHKKKNENPEEFKAKRKAYNSDLR